MRRGTTVPPRERKWRKNYDDWHNMFTKAAKMHHRALQEPGLVCALGIDPSLTSTGVAVVLQHPQTSEIVDAVSGTIRTDPKQGDGRLLEIAWTLDRALAGATVLREGEAVTGLYNEVKSKMVAAVEDLPKHAHGAGITGMAQGIVRHWLHDNDLAGYYASVPPASLKKFATGKGNATKDQMGEAYDRVFTGHDNGSYYIDDNQVDAAFLALWAVQHVAPVVHE